MKNFSKALSILLCFALIATLFVGLGTITTSAVGTEAKGKRDLDSKVTYWYSDEATSTYTSGSGTADDPWIITTAAQLRHAARGTTSKKYYKLGCDIVINDTSTEKWYEGTGLKNWIKGTDEDGKPVSDQMNDREMGGKLFRSEFDGAGYTISGLYINYEGTGSMYESNNQRVHCGWALFPYVYGATFKNVKIKDVYIKSNVTSTKTDEYNGYGALVGISYGDSKTETFENIQIENVIFDVAKPKIEEKGKPAGIGGIMGYSYGTIMYMIIRLLLV